MITGRPIIAGLMCLPFRDLAAFGGDIQPQKDVMLRPRLARLHPCCAPLPPPLGRARSAGFAAALECNVPEIARGREQGAAANFGV
jgi:hypothetical protein